MDQMPGRVTDMAEIESSNIWIAAGEGRLDLVEYFITHHSVNVNTKDEFSYSPLHAAVSYSQSSVVAFLIQSGADVNIQDGDGDGPLHVCEDVSIARLLVDSGADPGLRNDDGWMPIEIAFEQGFTEIVEFLKEFTPNYTHLNREDEELENELSEAEALERIQSLMSGGATTMDEDGDPVLTIRVPADAVRELRVADEESDEDDTGSESSRSRRRAFPGQSEEEQR